MDITIFPTKRSLGGCTLNRVRRILEQPFFLQCLEQNAAWEKDRLFCHHDLTHLLDVARIAYILALESPDEYRQFTQALHQRSHAADARIQGVSETVKDEKAEAVEKANLTIDDQIKAKAKEVIYSAALLHDMGKWKQYETGEDHAKVGAELCKPLLKDCGFSDIEIDLIAEAIRHHRKKERKMSPTFLGQILARADGYSRLCCRCEQTNDCNWKKKQETLIY
ncbi:HD domain-containing protein [Heliobacterium chlorum]|uniref:HD domain-containing protein n=1 Tax=Heliobacterium chlorum TaxID=2698 RepID=A0ABR7T0B1_HELCL|nr:HD domain-containing protein [Heliobacterium chlorum]MBC9784233.1 HD domain-containing protein [Heliobacterium chlorum]